MRGVEAQLIHDLRNTAHVISTAAAQLHDQRETTSPALQQRLTEMVARRSEMMVRLLDDIAILHQADQGQLSVRLQPVDLAEVCAGVTAARDLPDGTSVTVEVDDAVALADPLRLTQVLDNLLTNALRYGGPRVVVRGRRDGSVVRVAVCDDGPGVPAELGEDVFTAYTRGPESNRLGGSGLGLLIVRQLCRALGGEVRYDGAHGACFEVVLPAVPTVAATPVHDLAGHGHPVTFWDEVGTLVDGVADYAVTGLVAGEAVVLAATEGHHALFRAELADRGVDVEAVLGSGQLVLVDAQEMHDGLLHGDRVDPAAFERLIATRVRAVHGRFASFRVFGEIVDLYWREGRQAQALELEACWNELRRRLPFPLLCGYELAARDPADGILECHDHCAA